MGWAVRIFPKKTGLVRLINSPEISETNDISLNILSIQK